MNDTVPERLHVKVAEGFIRRILTEQCAINSRLPSVHTLAAEAGVSRETASLAVQYLVKSGVLRAKPGTGVFYHSAEAAIQMLRKVADRSYRVALADYRLLGVAPDGVPT